ncbi:MAG: hypothetical protein SR2Q5_04710 [Quinella sp. 2Q5]|nr:hypothetical protein [Quinella sp. 2Q5]
MVRKIPVVFAALTPLADAIETANDFCKQGLNIAFLAVMDSTPSQP